MSCNGWSALHGVNPNQNNNNNNNKTRKTFKIIFYLFFETVMFRLSILVPKVWLVTFYEKVKVILVSS